jgi:predicted  nucleic acid-binding Zn-ribbon protein
MAVNSSKTAEFKVIVDTDTGLIKIKGLTKGFKEADEAFKELNTSLKTTTKDGLNPLINKSGLAGAAVQEMGRTISDSNYGIQGMANNLSQLGSLFTNLISTTGGFTNALGAMWKALAGPLGIIIAFQTLLAVWEGVAIRARSTKSAINKLHDALADAHMKAVEIETLANVFKEADEGSVEYKGALQKLKKDGYDPLLGSIDDFVKKQKELFALQVTQDVLRDKMKSLVKEKLELDEQIKNNTEEIAEASREGFLEKFFPSVANIKKGATAYKVLVTEATKEAVKEQDKLIKTTSEEWSKVYAEVLALMNISGSNKEGKTERIDTIKGIMFGTTVEIDMAAKKAKDQAIKALEKEMKQAAEETNSTISKLLIAVEDTTERDLAEQDRYRRRLDGIKAFYEEVGNTAWAAADFLDASYEREITLEQNKTNAINNELRSRLDNEKLSADERNSIQNQIYQNDEKLRKRQEQIEEKRFKMQKAANIAGALIETYLAAVKALRNGGGAPTGLPAMFATIATGLLQVSAIAKQKFQASASSAPPSLGGAGGGSGGGQQAPDFNIVGSSGVNQLRTAIEGQLNRPIKTYVTTKDVSTGQELDRNIVNGATFGN